MTRIITSLQNPAIKNVILLSEKPRARREQNRIVIEGAREIRQAMGNGFAVTDLFICREIAGREAGALPANVTREPECFEVTAEVFNRMAYREDSGGMIALAEPRRLTLAGLDPGPNPLLLVLETVEKPGNLGAILRTADAAGLHAVIVCDPQTDIYNPNAIRSSLGCIFTLPVVTASSEETLAWLKTLGITAYGTALPATRFYHEADFTGPSAIIMGSEAAGLSRIWIEGAGQLIRIPMLGKVDSMNVSVSAAIVVFEALRQRGFR
ncbi:MAG TPA: RNA methyltransferase [Bacteroidales bacterium]|nr:RNA methyltransferase [Bacteroidales bacterium]